MKRLLAVLLSICMCVSLIPAAFAVETEAETAGEERFTVDAPAVENGRQAADAVTNGVPLSTANFPDDTFRAYVKENVDTDGNNQLSDDEIAAFTVLDVSSKGITSLKGVEYLTALESIYCDSNALTELDVSSNTKLVTLQCASNQIPSLNVSKNTELVTLHCGSNALTALSVSKNTKLQYLYCQNNQIGSLTVSSCPELISLGCWSNALTALNVTKNTRLSYLSCENNDIAELNISQCPNLLDAYENGTFSETSYYYYFSSSMGTLYIPINTNVLTNAVPPVITTSPSGKTVAKGETAKFTVKATGTDLCYQWQYRTSGTDTWKTSTMTGAKTATLSVEGTTARNGYQYRCKVYNVGGAVYSKAATLTVVTTPTITTQPASVKAKEDATAKFTVAASGGGLSYQWQYRTSSTDTWKNSSLDSAKAATLSVKATAARTGYQYRCKVTNKAGTTYTNAATLTVLKKPVITTQPKTVYTTVNATAKFTVAASGSGLSYQWQYRTSSTDTWKTSTMTGAKTAALSVPATTARSGNQYRCKVTNSGGTVYTNAVKLIVVTTPTITTQPTSVSAKEDATASFTVKASGGGLSYQWQYRSSSAGTWTNCPLDGANSATLTMKALAARSGNQYRCKVSNAAGTVYTKTVTLTVLKKPVITTQPKNISAKEDATAKFTVAASGSGLSYQWQYRTSSTGTWRDSTLTGAKTAALSVTATMARDGYQYRCKVTNSGGTVYTGAATLTVIAKPAITTQPASKSVKQNATVKFTVKATGGALNYQWQYRTSSAGTWKDSTLDSAKSATLTLNATGSRNGYQYRCKVSNTAGTVYSDAATLTIDLIEYRALLVGEVTFSWETANRNRGDVQLMANMLKSVKGAEGNPYTVKSAYDLDNDGIHSAIVSAFSGADSNDVSLFFIATHGVVDVPSGDYAGELVTIGSNGYEEYLTLGELAGWLKEVPGKVIVLLGSCGSGAAIVENGTVRYSQEDLSKAFNDAAVKTFAAADECVGDQPNTGEFCDSKFYVLTAAAHQQSSWGQESSDPYNYFPYWFAQGASGSKPADTNGDGTVTMKEMYTYIQDNASGPYYDGESYYYQDVQMYPENSNYGLFK